MTNHRHWQAWNTLRGRETVALARELLGGNGVVSDFLVAKAFSDMEAIYTCAMCTQRSHRVHCWVSEQCTCYTQLRPIVCTRLHHCAAQRRQHFA